MPVNNPQNTPKVNQNKSIMIMVNNVKPTQNITNTVKEAQKIITLSLLTYLFIEHDSKTHYYNYVLGLISPHHFKPAKFLPIKFFVIQKSIAVSNNDIVNVGEHKSVSI